MTTTLLDPDLDLSRPYLCGEGPTVFSTCTDLVPVSAAWVTDANGYYAALGVHTRATRRELREAYVRRDGQNSPYLTYVLTQLLDRRTRRIYDCARLGRPIVDRYGIQTILERLSGNDFEKKAIYIRRIVDLLPPGNTQTSLDSGGSDGHDEGASPDTGYPYSYYILRSTTEDPSLLPEWQRLLVSAFHEHGIDTNLSLGLHGLDTLSWVVQRVGYERVVFVHHDATPHHTTADDVARFFSTLNGAKSDRNAAA